MTLTEKLKLAEVNPRALITIEPRARVEGWNLTAGKTYTYEVAWSIRRPSKVSEDGTDLTKKYSLAGVEVSAGSWYWDYSAEKLYVHTTGGDSPAGHIMILESVFRFCSQNSGSITWYGQVYEPLIADGGAPEVQDSLPDLFFSKGAFHTIDFSLVNSDGYFDRISRTYIWENAVVKVYYGLPGFDFADFETAFIGTLQDPSWDVDTISFSATDLRKLLEEELPKDEYSKDDWPDLADGDDGRDIPIFYGAWNDVLCTLIDLDGANRKYSISGHRLESILYVKIGGTPTSPSNWTADLPNGRFTLTIDPGADAVTADIKGKHNGTKYLERGIDQALDLAQQSNIPAELIDTDSFSEAADANPVKTRLKIESKRNISEAVSDIARDCFLILDFSSEGKLSARTWQPEIPPATEKFEEADFVSTPQGNSRTDDIYMKIILEYGQDYADDEPKKIVAESAESELLYRRSKTLTVSTGIVETQDAQNAADYYLFFSKSRALRISVTLGPKALTLRIGDKIRLEYYRAPNPEGAWTGGRYFEVIGYRKNLNNFHVWTELDDLKGLGTDLCILTSDEAQDWENSSGDERDSQGYLGDSAGYVDPENTRKKYIL